MDKKFLIRTTALKLLEKIYLESRNDLTAVLNPLEIMDEDINEKIIKQAILYLLDKQYIMAGDIIREDWTASITGKGVDWVEDCHSVNPLDIQDGR